MFLVLAAKVTPEATSGVTPEVGSYNITLAPPLEGEGREKDGAEKPGTPGTYINGSETLPRVVEDRFPPKPSVNKKGRDATPPKEAGLTGPVTMAPMTRTTRAREESVVGAGDALNTPLVITKTAAPEAARSTHWLTADYTSTTPHSSVNKKGEITKVIPVTTALGKKRSRGPRVLTLPVAGFDMGPAEMTPILR